MRTVLRASCYRWPPSPPPAAGVSVTPAHCVSPRQKNAFPHFEFILLCVQKNEAAPPRSSRQRRDEQLQTTSWGTLAEAARLQLPVAPRFAPAQRQRQKGVLLTAADFPTGPLPSGAGPGQPDTSWRPQLAAQAPRCCLGAETEGAAEQLLRQHSWAGRELVAAVMQAAGQDGELADALLADMVASDTAAAGQPQRAEAQVATAGAAAADPGPAVGSAGSDDEPEMQQGPYFLHRRNALLLTRRWQRTTRSAAAAYSAGQHAAARQLAAQAQGLRRQALAAHAEAAERIETDNNRHNRWARRSVAGTSRHKGELALWHAHASTRASLAPPRCCAHTHIPPPAACLSWTCTDSTLKRPPLRWTAASPCCTACLPSPPQQQQPRPAPPPAGRVQACSCGWWWGVARTPALVRPECRESWRTT